MSIPLASRSGWHGIAAHLEPPRRTVPLRTRPPERVELEQHLGFAHAPQGLYEELQHRCGPFDSGAHYINDLASARLNQIVSARHTGVQAANGSWLAANRIQIGRVAQLVTSQYPLAEQLEPYLLTLMQQRVPLLVVLTSKQEMLRADLAPYFCQNRHYGCVAVKTAPGQRSVLPHGLALQSYDLTLSSNDQHWNLKVVQVENWSASQLPSSAALHALALQLQQQIGPNPAAAPWLHGVAGVGRSAVLAGALALLQPEVRSLEAIVTEMRISRAPNMLETPAQLDLLADIAEQLQIALLDRDVG